MNFTNHAQESLEAVRSAQQPAVFNHQQLLKHTGMKVDEINGQLALK